MHRCFLAACLISMGNLSTAQSHVVSPSSDYVLSEGAGSSFAFGSFAAGRFQFADGNSRNNAMPIKSLSFRYDHRNYNVTEGMGRSWNKVTIDVAECDLGTFGATYSTNATTTPSRVFDGPISWPIQLNSPATVPAPWSVKLPFTSVWSYSGAADILTDFRFSGGTLNNRASWSGNVAHSYVLDSFSVGTLSPGPQTIIGRVNGGCFDSSSTSVVGASLRLDITSYGPNVSNTSLRNKYIVESTGSNFAANTSTVLVLAFAANTIGIPFPGVTCNRLYLTTQRMWFLHPVVSNMFGEVDPYRFGYPVGTPYTPRYHGINLVVQAVWNDTKNGQLLFSSLARNSFVTLPLASANDVKMKTAYGSNPAASVASSTASGDSTQIPLFRYGN